MNVLVTGGAGYIGSHVCKELFIKGYSPVVFDNFLQGHLSLDKWGEYIKGDLKDYDSIKNAIKKTKPIAVIHMASFADVGESYKYPNKYFYNNIGGSLNLFKAMEELSVELIIFSSTCSVYGLPRIIPIKENAPKSPINPYGLSKNIVEDIIFELGKKNKIRYKVLRYFNAAGCDNENETGELHNPETHIIPSMLNTLKSKEKLFTVFGTDYDTKDGTCIRDYIHVSDLASAHVLSLSSLLKDSTSGVYNLSNEHGYSVLDIIHNVERITGKKVNVKFGNRRNGDPDILIGDSSKIRKELGWISKNSDLENIISTAWNWNKHIPYE